VPAPAPSLLHVALAGRCPRCGQGRLFRGLLDVRDSCEVCGLDLREHDAGDGAVVGVILLLGAIVVVAAAYYILASRFHVRPAQLVELSLYALYGLLAAVSVTWYFATLRRRREENWPHPPLYICHAKDRRAVAEAHNQNSIVLGYDVHGKPWFWSDATRVMQSVVFGATGSGKTTLLRNIITQDLTRRVGPAQDRHKVPIVIFDGKGDLDFFYELLPHINRAGRLGDLRLINPARPELSCLYNPFHTTDENYMAQVNMVFGSFNLHDEFFAKHQLNYLADIVRILHYTGVAFNFYDVIVMALDEEVLREQIEKARRHIQADREVSMQRGLNFEMSVRNLLESFHDRERVPKIQGLLNECMTFLDDELSVITGPYEDLLSIDDVIDQELILFVTLNINKNTEPVRALGKMLLQNLQLVVGKRFQFVPGQAELAGDRGFVDAMARAQRRDFAFLVGFAGQRAQPVMHPVERGLLGRRCRGVVGRAGLHGAARRPVAQLPVLADVAVLTAAGPARGPTSGAAVGRSQGWPDYRPSDAFPPDA